MLLRVPHARFVSVGLLLLECGNSPNTTATPPSAASNIVLTFSERKFHHPDKDASALQQGQQAPQDPQKLPENANP